MKRILIISELHIIKTFIIPTFSKLKQGTNVQFDCFIPTNVNQLDIIELNIVFTNIYFNKYNKGIFSNIPKLRFLKFMFGLIKMAEGLINYDIAHINYHHYYYAFIAPIIRKKVRKLYITFYGSDFNDLVWFKHILNKKSTKIADKIFVTENPEFLKTITTKYGIQNVEKRTGILFPLISSFELFEDYLMRSTIEDAKSVFGIYNKRMIVSGYNAAPIVRHEEIIKVLVNLKDKLTDYILIFPMTYGNLANTTRLKVKSLLKYSGLNYKVLEEFLSVEKLLALRFAADIFIHIQTKDQMASSLLEHLAAGSVVITGKWLPYGSLEKLDIYFIQIEKVEDLKEALLKVMDNLGTHLELCKKNRAIILNLTSWGKNKLSWYKAYDLVEE